MNTSATTPLSAATFSSVLEESNNRPVLVDFWAPWCGPCKAQGPIVDQVAQDAGDNAHVTKLNIDDAEELAESLRIRSIPTLIVFRHGREAARFTGLQSARTLSAALEQAR